MDFDWTQWIPCIVAQWIPIKCSEFCAAWLNAVHSMQREEMEPYWMQWFFYSMNECRVIECSGCYAAWPKASRLNAVDSMQCGPMDLDWTQCIPCSEAQWIPIECSGFHAAWRNGCRLNAVVSLQCGTMDQYRLYRGWCWRHERLEPGTEIQCSQGRSLPIEKEECERRFLERSW